jgi:hypothetical protein
MRSRTLSGAYHLAAMGGALVGVFLALVYLDVPPATLEAFADLAEWLLGTVAAALGVYGSRNLPLPNRAPTSAEMHARAAER